MNRQTVISTIIAAALLAAVPAKAVSYILQGDLISRSMAGSAVTIVYNGSRYGSDDPIALALSSSDGYAAFNVTSANGGTASTVAFGQSDRHLARGDTIYDLLLDAPSTVSAKLRLSFSGLLSSWGSGYAFAEVSVGDWFADYNSFDPLGAPKSRSFKVSRTVVATGGRPVSIFVYSESTVNALNPLGAGRLGFASAYVDPTVTFSAAVPEPASWALLIAGFAMTGAALRRRAALLAA